ncbi:MAG: response regulator [Alphaproteobacteria bacterium]|nr:response regulator [Alphaproteobacteria bacterium]
MVEPPAVPADIGDPLRRARARVPRWLVVALPISAILLGGVISALFLVHLRSEELASGERLIRSFAQIAEEQTVRIVQSAQRTLGLVEQTLNDLDPAEAADGPGVGAVLRSLIGGREFLLSIWVLDAAGRVVYDLGGNFGLDLSDRDYFLRHRQAPESGTTIAAPIRSRASGAWLIPVTAPWRRAGGEFAGVIVVALDPRYFDRLWTLELASADRAVALFRRDGMMLMRSPFVESVMGQSFADLPVFRDHLPARPVGSLQANGNVDRRPRILGYRVIAAYPELVIVVGDTVDHFLTSWRRTAYMVAAGWLAGSAAILLLTAWLMREWRRRLQGEGMLAAANATLRAEVAERSRAEGEAEAARVRLVDAIRAFPGSFRLFDRDERLVLTNDVRWVPLGVEAPAIRPGVTIAELVRIAADREFDAAAVGRREEWLQERLAQFRRGYTDAEVAWRDGRWFHLLERRTSDGGTISLRLDITARKRIEEELRQAQKMEAVGQLTGGIAHDFNNMLTVIIGNAELIVDHPGADAQVRAASELILRAAAGSADLTGRLLAFARRSPLQPRRVDISRFVARIDGLLRRALGEEVDISLVPSAHLWEVTIDPSQLETAILNLAVNARDAMPNGGKLTIETANVEIDADYAAANQDAQVGQFVMVAISDTGEGMTPETMRRAFEPFFSTKEVGKGTGLGLSMVYGFVRQSGGHVKIYSEVGRGTTIRMYLPRAVDADPPIDGPDIADSPRAARGERILVVEDDDLVRAHVAGQLKALGYQVIDAANGDAAVDILSGPAPLDLLLTDVVMPGGMTGRDVADAAQRLRPGLPVIFMSGYTRNAIIHGGRLDADARLLSKPFRLREIAAKVREALDDVSRAAERH